MTFLATQAIARMLRWMSEQEVGMMPDEMFARYSASPEAREAMDEEVREYFEIPIDRYFTVTMPPGDAGKVFVDLSKTRAVGSVKLSKAP